MSAFKQMDLTPFDGITPGEWSLPHFVEAKEGDCMCQYVFSDGYMGSIATVDYSDDDVHPDGDNPPIEEARKNARAIHSVPRFIAALRAAYAEMDRISGCIPRWRTVGADLTNIPLGNTEVLVDIGGTRCVAHGAQTWRGVTFWNDDNLQLKIREGHKWIPISELQEQT